MSSCFICNELGFYEFVNLCVFPWKTWCYGFSRVRSRKDFRMRQGKDVMSDGYDKLTYLLPLRKGNVFTSVCHYSCPQEGGLPGGGLYPEWVCIHGGLSRGVCIQGGVSIQGDLHRGGSAWGSLHTGGSAWGVASRLSLSPGGVCLEGFASRGICIGGGLPGGVYIQGGLPRGVCIERGVGQIPSPIRYYGILSTSGRYTSYWNAFLFLR